jgi:cAMP-dependent protein kinase regulator
VSPSILLFRYELTYSAPRAASILSKTPCTLWALDRVSFRTILLDVSLTQLIQDAADDKHTSRKRRLYESFLSEVPILSSLQPQERAKIADVLESRTFVEGEDVILEGDAGEEFFLIESGTASAIKGDDTVVKQYVKGDYFGGRFLSLLLCEHQLMNRIGTAKSTSSSSIRPSYFR